MTFGAIRSRIADELVRPELSSQIALAVYDAIKEAATTSFWFNEVRGLTFNMVPGQSFYDAGNADYIPRLERIDALWIVVAGQRRNLELRNALDIESWSEGFTGTGQPSAYARQTNGLVFWMSPDQSYPVYINGVAGAGPFTSDDDTNAYLEDGERYVRAIAKARLLEDVIRDFDEADRQWTLVEREKQILLRETGSRTASRTNAAFL